MRLAAGTSGSRIKPAWACPRPWISAPNSVHRNPNAPFGQAEQRRIAGIATQGSDLENIVSLAAQPLRQPATGTAVNQETQADVTRTASRLSSASAACA
jgi:hypothetical protein